MWADLGAYLLSSTAIPPHTAAMLITGCYDIPAAEVTVVGARTNKVPTGPYRGAGRPDAAYLIERLVDDAARALAIDRVELRRRNLIRRFPHRTPLGYVYDSGDYERCIDVALGLGRDQAQRPAGNDRVSGTGLAVFVERAGGGWETRRSGAARRGRARSQQLTAPRSGSRHDVRADRVRPAGGGDRAGRAALRRQRRGAARCRHVRQPLGGGRRLGDRGGHRPADLRAGRALAAELLGTAVADVEWDHARRRYVAGAGAVSFDRVARAAHAPEHLVSGAEPGLRAAGRFDSEPVFSSGAYAAAVEIERSTGRLDVLWLAAVDDAGTLINPLLSHGR